MIEYRKPTAAAKAPTSRKTLGSAVLCPHCGSRSMIRTSRQITEIYREGYSICLDCSFMSKYAVQIIGEAAPSCSPNPRVNLPKIPRHQAVSELGASLEDSDQLALFDRPG